MKKLVRFGLTAAALTAMAAMPAFAAGSLTSVSTLFDTILSVLQGLAVVVVTIAVIWAGYKVLFKGASIMEVAGPLMGAILIGAASYLADLLVGSV